MSLRQINTVLLLRKKERLKVKAFVYSRFIFIVLQTDISLMLQARIKPERLCGGFKTDVAQFSQETIDSDRFDSNAKI